MKKLNIKKVGLTLSLVSAISVCSAIPALADWEQQTDGNWKYKNDDGSYVTSSLIDGYYVNGDGIWLEDIKADNGSFGSWKNEKVAINMGREISKSNDWTADAITVYSNSATYGRESAVIELLKIDNGYNLTLYTRIQSDNSIKGLKALTYLLCDDDTLYQILYNAFEGDNSYGINADNYTEINSYQIKATVTNKSVSFSIKTV